MIKEEIENYFKLSELKYLKSAENIWRVPYRNLIANYDRHFEISVTLLDEWLYLGVPLVVADNDICLPYLTEYLLGLNHQLFFTKIALRGRQILLMVELPVRSTMLDLEEAMIALRTYVRAYFLDIETMATSPHLASLVLTALKGEAAGEPTEETEVIPDIIFNE